MTEQGDIIRQATRTLEDQFLGAQAMLEDANADITRLMAENMSLAEALAICEGGHPPARGTLIGISGSTEIDGATQRSFTAGPITGAISRYPKAFCPQVHHSWKVVDEAKGTFTIPADPALKNALANFLPGDAVEVEHEEDAKYRKDVKAGNPKALANLRLRIDAKRAFNAAVMRVRPDLITVDTLTSFAFEKSQLKDLPLYTPVSARLGADLDGGAFPHDYGEPTRLEAIVKHADANYGGDWCVPEFGWKDDPAGKRMGQITSQIAAIAAFGPTEINYHNNPSFGATLTPAEIVQYTALVEQYNG